MNNTSSTVSKADTKGTTIIRKSILLTVLILSLLAFLQSCTTLATAIKPLTQTKQQAETNPNTQAGKTPQQMIDIFFNLHDTRSTPAALDYLFANNPYIYEKQDIVNQLKEKLRTAESLFGKKYGQALIQSRQTGDTIQMITYLVKYDRQPLRFTFVFYKPNDRWLTFQFNFDDPLDSIMSNEARSVRFEPVVE